jgi:hypothetical protein
MGFYIRKGFNFGPLRLNLSRSGLGASFGVKGARIGVGPRGSYVHMGRGGLYYRQTLSPRRPGEFLPSPVPAGKTPAQPAFVSTDGLQEIASASATALTDSSSSNLLTELNRVNNRQDRLPIVVLLGAILVGVVWVMTLSWWTVLPVLLTTALGLYARHLDVLKGTAILNYSLESDAAHNFANLQAPFRQLAQSERVWHIEAKGYTPDWKRNAGVNTLLNRKEVRPSFSRPPKVQCNLELPTLKAGKTTLYFFPDRLLVYDSSGVGAVPYADLEVHTETSRFVESEKVPGDSQQVDSTWQYVNKKGGPDRRFSNNRQLPIMPYGVVAFSSGSGLNALFMCSRVGVLPAFRTAFAHANVLGAKV